MINENFSIYLLPVVLSSWLRREKVSTARKKYQFMNKMIKEKNLDYHREKIHTIDYDVMEQTNTRVLKNTLLL